jgi:hypothetical protein
MARFTRATHGTEDFRIFSTSRIDFMIEFLDQLATKVGGPRKATIRI